MRRALAVLVLAALAVSIGPQALFAGKAYPSRPPTPTTVQSLWNLKQLGTAMMMYQQDNDGLFPPMKNWSKLQAALDPYTRGRSIFTNPITKRPYKANTWLSGRNQNRIASPTSVVVFYEATPAGDGTRGAAFADGHAKRVPESAWTKVKTASKIP